VWLPKYERRLLQGYHFKVRQVKKDMYVENIQDWVAVMKSLFVKHAVHQIGKTPKRSSAEGGGDKGIDDLKKDTGEFFEVNSVNVALKEPGLIDSTHYIDYATSPSSISLTITGYDLGRKYNSWWKRSGLWFAEYKDHWFWLILGFLGGIIGALIVNWLS